MSATETKRSKIDKPILQSKEYRTVYVNAFRMRFKDNDVTLSLAAEVDDPEGNEIIQDEVRVIMTPRTAKVLLLSLSNIIAKFEETLGPIQLPAGKEEEIAKSAVKVPITKIVE